MLVLESNEVNYQCFNVGGGRAYTVIDFYNKMQEVTGREVKPIISRFYRYGDTRHIFSDITKLKGLGWQPKIPIEESIRQYWDYLTSQTDIEDILEYAEKTMKSKGVIRAIR
jgi:dTDP-L-rhamnose 4-epimerase